VKAETCYPLSKKIISAKLLAIFVGMNTQENFGATSRELHLPDRHHHE
jgi:hypothetical protein